MFCRSTRIIARDIDAIVQRRHLVTFTPSYAHSSSSFNPSSSSSSCYFKNIITKYNAALSFRHTTIRHFSRKPKKRRVIASSSHRGRKHAGLNKESATTTEPPSTRALQLVALNQGLPFIGFGIMDNAILILAGDAIDASLGVALGISTMCAAAIGNIISDVAGVMLGTVIEDICSKFGLPIPKLTHAQRKLRVVRFVSQFGCAIGLTIGCIIGMFPLLFIDSNKVQKKKHEALVDEIFRDIITEAGNLVDAEACGLFLIVDEPDQQGRAYTPVSAKPSDTHVHLWGKHLDGSFTKTKHCYVRVDLSQNITSRVVLSGKTVNIADVDAIRDFDKDVMNSLFPHSAKNMVAIPVFNALGEVIAVMLAINKNQSKSRNTSRQRQDDLKSYDRRMLRTLASYGTRRDVFEENSDEAQGGFTLYDVQVLQALASHVSVSLQNLNEENVKLSLAETIKILKEHGKTNFVNRQLINNSR